MFAISPLIVVLLATAAGAGIMAFLFQQNRLGAGFWGGVLGSGVGAAGALAVMVPMNFCPFVVEVDADETLAAAIETREIIGFILGGSIALASVGLATWVVFMLAGYFLQGRSILPQGEMQLGAFTGKWAGLTAFLLLLPTISILAFFHYYPMGQTFRLSTLLARFGRDRTVFICMDNFTELFADPDYWYSLGLSFFLAIAIMFIGLSLSLLIAVMAHMPIKGARIYRTLLVWPYALSPVIAGIIFQLMFNNTAGVLNYVLESTVGTTVPWLLSPNIAPWTVVMTGVWNIMGYNILFYLAGLQNVPDDLLEAAAIDGANVFERFFRITIPLLSPITFFLIVTNTTYAFFDTFGLIDFLTGGGPVNRTTTMMYEVYEVGVVDRNLGEAAARSMVLFLIVIGVTILQFRASRNRVNYGG